MDLIKEDCSDPRITVMPDMQKFWRCNWDACPGYDDPIPYEKDEDSI